MASMSWYWFLILGIAGLATIFAIAAVVYAFRARSRRESEAADQADKVVAEVAAVWPASREMSDEEVGHMVGMARDLEAQANLLALNTAIAAARAGEQSESLATVAEELQRLADRAGQITKEAATATGKAQRSATADSSTSRR